MIELTDVTERYGSTVAIHDLSFEVRPGEVTGFLGPDGAGKSTTMRMMVGLVEDIVGAQLSGRGGSRRKAPNYLQAEREGFRTSPSYRTFTLVTGLAADRAGVAVGVTERGNMGFAPMDHGSEKCMDLAVTGA